MAMVPSDFSYHGVVDNGPNGFTQGRREEASKLGSSWYFSRKELEENSPSRRDGIDWKKESNLRKSYCKFLQDLGKKLKLPQLTIATAMVFCHRFYLRQSLAKNDRRIIATVCMFLAGKVEETPIPLKDVILISYEFIHKKDPTAGQRIKQQKELFDKQKEFILLGERVVLVTLEFDLNIHHAYKPLVEAIRRFNVGDINNFPQVAWSFVNDGLSSTSLCLQFEPHHIAAGVIFLAAKFLKVKLPSDGDKFWWQEFGVTLQQLEDFSNQMLELYQQNRTTQAQPSHGGEAKGSAAGVRNQHSSVKSEENSKEPSAHGRHQVSRLSNLQHSSSTGAPGHHDVGHSNSDKHFSGHKILQNDNGGSKVKNMSGTKSDACMDRLHHDKRSSPGHHYSKASYESHNLAEEHKPHRSHDNSNQTRDSVGDKDAPGLSTLRMDVVHKIDKDKVKAALEKQSKSKGGVSTKMDDDDLLDRGLEHGVELAVEDEKAKQDKRQNLSQGSMPPADLQNTNQEMESGHHVKQGVPTTAEDMGFPDSKEHPPPFYKQNDAPEHKAQQLDHTLKHQKGQDHSQIV
ncbi:cyclin-T1-4-like [Miscanthus floridulus]|uniref:cyclin-T1-4-like n=1 Tax=Miscanthus floridulus TaxID=154761 RepID=UPI003459E1B6